MEYKQNIYVINIGIEFKITIRLLFNISNYLLTIIFNHYNL